MKVEHKVIGLIIIALLCSGVASALFVTHVNAQSEVGSSTIGLWHFDEIKPDEYREITPDATGQNNGMLVHTPTSPELVEGKFDKAMRFDGENGIYIPIRFIVGFPPSPQPIYIPISTSLDIQKEIKIEAWINVQGFKNVTYNNIAVKCTHPDGSWQNTTRIVGLAIKAGIPENSISVPEGALSGYVYTDTGGFNEIVTEEPVISLNKWTHVAFTRTSNGMHIYVDGVEQQVKTLYGVQNPIGSILNGTEVYFGHDAEVIIDELRISDLAPEPNVVEGEIEIGSNMLMAIIIVSVVFATAWLLRRAIQMWVIRSRPKNS